MEQGIEITVNGRQRTIAAGATVADLVRDLGFESARVAVERNREIVPRATHNDVSLQAGDKLEVVTFVGGG